MHFALKYNPDVHVSMLTAQVIVNYWEKEYRFIIERHVWTSHIKIAAVGKFKLSAN